MKIKFLDSEELEAVCRKVVYWQHLRNDLIKYECKKIKYKSYSIL